MDTPRTPEAPAPSEAKSPSTAPAAPVEWSHSFLQVGGELYPIVGDGKHGWNIDDSEFSVRARMPIQYATLDELYFALLNLSVCPQGSA